MTNLNCCHHHLMTSTRRRHLMSLSFWMGRVNLKQPACLTLLMQAWIPMVYCGQVPAPVLPLFRKNLQACFQAGYILHCC
jgi:hypothetical protein